MNILYYVKVAIAIAIAATAAATTTTLANPHVNVDHLTTFATVYGRGMACSVPKEEAEEVARRIARWMDRINRPGSHDHQMFLLIFIQGVQFHAQQQAKGRSPDSCSVVRRNFRNFPWPRP